MTELKRADGTTLRVIRTGPHTFRLTKDGKPFNVAKEIERKFPMPSDALIEGSTERARREFSQRTTRNAEIGGYLGMAAIHGATLPVSVGVIMGWTSHLPPLSMVLLVWIGLILFFVRALVRFDWLYLISNGIGLVANSVLLILIVYGS